MKTIHLYGSLATKFGDKVSLDVDNAQEAIRALCVTRPDFEDLLRDGSFILIRYSTPRGARLRGQAFRDAMENEGIQLDVDTLTLGLGKSDLHIVPVISGAGGKGLGKVLLGVALIAGGWALAPIALEGGFLGANMAAALPGAMGGLGMTYGSVAFLGAIMALSGMSMMLTKPPKAPESSKETNFIFNGVANVGSQGNAVPLIYGGPILCGSLTVSSSINSEITRGGGALVSEKLSTMPGGGNGMLGMMAGAYMDRNGDGIIDGTEYRDTTNSF